MRALSWVLFVAVFAAWVWFFLPVSLGGGTSFVIVQGHSMEPLLSFGDLAVARRADSYAAGEVVVFQVDDGNTRAMVIHRLLAESPEGWQTQGDNNSFVDGWVLPTESIHGRYWFAVPGAGRAMTGVLEHPYGGAGIAAALTLVLYVPLRPRRVPRELRAALEAATPEQAGRPTRGELAILAMAGVATAATGFIVLVSWVAQAWTTATSAALAGLVLAAAFTAFLTSRLFNGTGLPEPDKSLHTLAGRVHTLPELPALETPPTPVRSAVGLRELAEKYRLPVLHTTDPETGRHTFLLLTKGGAYQYETRPDAAGTEASVQGEHQQGQEGARHGCRDGCDGSEEGHQRDAEVVLQVGGGHHAAGGADHGPLGRLDAG